MGKFCQTKTIVKAPELASQSQELGESKKERVGILGGTFNPVHNGHTLIAEQVYNQLQLDRILFMPNAIPPHQKPKETLADDHRLNMLDLAIRDNDHFAIEAIELDRKGKSYTVDTMEILTTLYPNTHFYFIIGGDMVVDLDNWHRINDLIDLVSFVGVKREGYSLETTYPIITVDIIGSDISSSAIRYKCAHGQSIRYLVAEEVRHYINEKGLYLD